MRALSLLVGSQRAARPFVALVSPSIRTLYGPDGRNLVGFLRAEGAIAVYPVDSGIPEFARRCAREIAAKGETGTWILSACPASRPFIEREFPTFATRILSVPSPMALRSRAALSELGLEGSGYALAITPCSHKKSEQRTVKPEMLVIQIGQALEAARKAGIDPFSCPAADYDGAMPPDGLSCRIAHAVAEELNRMGKSAIGIRLDGEAAARDFFDEDARRRTIVAGTELIVAEVDFCEGGCSVPEKEGKT
jgi:hypothetical protein